MLKKILKNLGVILFILMMSTISFAKNTSLVTILPIHASNWGYMNATITYTNHVPIRIGQRITLNLPINEKIILTVYAMNSIPKLDNSCQNIQLVDSTSRQLQFELKPDWMVHCILK